MSASKVGVNYAWDHLKDNKKKIIFSDKIITQQSTPSISETIQPISIDNFENFKFSLEGKLFEGSINIRGISKVIKIKEVRIDQLVVHQPTPQIQDQEPQLGLVQLEIPEIGISIMNQTPKELVFIHFNLMAEYTFTKSKQTVVLTVDDFMISNQLNNPNYPVAVHFNPGGSTPEALKVSVSRKLFPPSDDIPLVKHTDDQHSKHFSMSSAPPPAPPPVSSLFPIAILPYFQRSFTSLSFPPFSLFHTHF